MLTKLNLPSLQQRRNQDMGFTELHTLNKYVTYLIDAEHFLKFLVSLKECSYNELIQLSIYSSSSQKSVEK